MKLLLRLVEQEYPGLRGICVACHGMRGKAPSNSDCILIDECQYQSMLPMQCQPEKVYDGLYHYKFSV
jgi:hypothetical protein